MNAMRERAKEHFPTVLLTLLSIVQALALEMLWSHIDSAGYLLEANWIAVISWLQIVATALGFVIIWVVYASNVMRFSWVPATTDSMYPFIIGLLEFLLVKTLGSDWLGPWFVFLALIVALMNWIAHITMRRARRDPDNEAFFSSRVPATLSDFYAEYAVVGLLAMVGVYLLINPEVGVFALLALLATICLLAGLFYQAARFWEQSISQ
jgi:hypothetical protein